MKGRLKWNNILYNLTSLWNILNFEIIKVSNDATDNFLPNVDFQKYSAFSSTKINRSSHSRSNQIIFYLSTNESEFWISFEQVALAHKKQVLSQAIRDSSIYHFLIWPPPLAEVAENELCSEIQRRNVSRFLVLNSNVFILYADTERRIHLYEVYAVQSSLICQPVINSIEFFEIANKVVRRVDFKGSVLTGTAAIQDITALEVRYEEVNGKIVSASGSAVRIFKDLMSSLNFRDNYTIGGWVNLNRSSGLVYGVSVDQMNSGMADLFLTQTTLSPFRARGFNYLQPTFHDSLNAFFQQPPSSTVNDVHISPFQPSLWLTMFATWALLSLSAFTIAYIQVKVRGRLMDFNKFEKFQESLIWSIAAGCNQGWHDVPKSTPLRIVLFCGAMTGLVNFITYSGSIISSLTSETDPIQNLVDLLSSSLEIYVDEDSSTLKQVVEGLKRTSVRRSGYIEASVATGLSKALTKPSALFGFSRSLFLTANELNISAHSLCDCLSSLPIQKLPLYNGMLVPKWSPYRESFNYKIIQLKEYGLNFRYLRTFMKESTASCPKVSHPYREDLGIYDVFTAFAILISGAGAALLVGGIEKVISYCYYRRKRS